MLEHWHPLCSLEKISRRPLSIRIANQDLVVFRCRDGTFGILENSCPHRRMKLSKGNVVQDRLVCPYHGWSFDCNGNGESPSSPKLRTQANAYRSRQAHGYLWVSQNGDAASPTFERKDGFQSVRPLEFEVDAPLELVLDNFTEVEHAATVHNFVGYDLDRMDEVVSDVRPTDDSVRIENQGPQKRIPTPIRWLYRLSRNAIFHWEWTTTFSPVCTVYDEYWTDSTNGKRQGAEAHITIFFCPVNGQRTRLVVFPAFRLPYGRTVNRICYWFKEIARRMVQYEILRDVRMIENLAEKKVEIEGMKLSRFDRPLALHRERIQRIYLKNPAQQQKTIPSA